MKLLIIDSDRDMVEMLTSLLKTYGYEVHRAYDGERARAEWLKHEPDLVIMDSTLSDADPAAICRDMQARHDALVLVLAERADAQTQVRYLDAGADAFLPKPFLPSHLLAYIRAIMRRVRNTLKTRPLSLVEVGPICVDSQRNQATVNGKLVHLTPIETKLLHLLAINAGDVCTAAQIVEHVWGYDEYGEAELIKAHIRHLRQKIEPDPGTPRYILNVTGVGYTLSLSREESKATSTAAAAAPGYEQQTAATSREAHSGVFGALPRLSQGATR